MRKLMVIAALLPLLGGCVARATWDVATAHAHAQWVKPGGRSDAADGIDLSAAARVIV